MEKIQRKVESIKARLTEQQNGGNPRDQHLGEFKTELSILNGRVDKLQFSGLDSVLVGSLTSGKGDARALRKSLNKQAFVLSTKIKEIHSRIGKDLFYRSISGESS